MKVLLDSQVWLWMQVSPEKLRPASRKLLESTANDLFLSAASSWEIAIKYAIGRLPLPEPPASYVPARLRGSGVAALAVEHGHALHVAELPAHHADPFDRLLVAQAQIEHLVLMSADRVFDSYDVHCIAA